jgi:acetoin utilization protein AcuB
MTPNPITISGITTLPEAYRLMVEHQTCRLLVMDQGTLAGEVTLEDLRRRMPVALGLYGAMPDEQYVDKTPVCHVMHKNLKTIQADSSLIEAARLLLDSHMSTIPVMDGGRLVGIITERELLKALVVQVEA